VSTQDDNSSKATAIRARLDRFSSVDDFIEGYNQYFFRGGMLLPTRQARSVGTTVSLQLEIADGTTVVRADGEVQQVRVNDAGRTVGMVVRFKRVDSATRDLMTRILRERHERRTGANTPDAPSPPPENEQTPEPGTTEDPNASRLADEDINAIESALDSTFDSIFGGSGAFPVAPPAQEDAHDLASPSRTEAQDESRDTLADPTTNETLHGVHNLLGEDSMALRRELAAAGSSETEPVPDSVEGDIAASMEAPDGEQTMAASEAATSTTDPTQSLDEAASDAHDAAVATGEPSSDSSAPPGVTRSTVFGMPALGDDDALVRDGEETNGDAGVDESPGASEDALATMLDESDDVSPDADTGPASASQPLTRLALQRKSKTELDAERRALLRSMSSAGAEGDERVTIEASPLEVGDDDLVADEDIVEDAHAVEVDGQFDGLSSDVADRMSDNDGEAAESDDVAFEVEVDLDSGEGPTSDDQPSDDDGLKGILHGIAAADGAAQPAADAADTLRRLEAQTETPTTIDASADVDPLDALLAEPSHDRPVIPPNVQLAKPKGNQGVVQRFFAWLARLFGGR
jgi:Tfp pilus assembly protein PilZ